MDRTTIVSSFLSYDKNCIQKVVLVDFFYGIYIMFQASTGGRITVFQSVLPSLGPGRLSSREDPNERASTVLSNSFQHLMFWSR